MNYDDERIAAYDKLYNLAHRVTNLIYPSRFEAAKKAVQLTDNIANIHFIDIAIGNLGLDHRAMRAQLSEPFNTENKAVSGMDLYRANLHEFYSYADEFIKKGY